jgi:hypothetical protein
MTRLLIGIAIVAVVATMGDYIWYEFGVRHRMAVGILHGAALLTAVGGVLGSVSGRVVAGLPIGTAAGIAGALTYYALASTLRQSAMLIAWATLWVVIAVLDGRLVRRGTRSLAESAIQGVTAAVLSGVTFYLVVGILWGRAPAGGRNYAIQLAAWAIAFAPGILAIGMDLKRKRRD